MSVQEQDQLSLELDDVRSDDPDFLTSQLITYIGNKRALLKPIEFAAQRVASDVGRPIRTLDAFAGSGVVSRLFKRFASHLVVNDLEPYAEVLARCYLSNRGDVDWGRVTRLIQEFNSVVASADSQDGFIERLYAPLDDEHIEFGERVFFTRDNARRLDHYAQLIQEVEESIRPYLLGPLLSAASIHANTAGVFKGFYKDRETGIGKFGGAGADALDRIKGRIELRPPILSEHHTSLEIHCDDANKMVRQTGSVDLAYFDPPYNQHPYGSNYFMLNLLVNYVEPTEVSSVSGIPTDWQRSSYNVRKLSLPLMTDLVAGTDARYLLISFNDEGYIAPSEMLAMLNEAGKVDEFQTQYNAFRGSRNLSGRKTHVTEHLYLVEKRR